MRSPGLVAATALFSTAVAVAASMAAQGPLAQLGLTEASARTLLFDELKAPTLGDRRGARAVAGHRAFYKLPPAARGPAAMALFAWAKAYVASPAFKSTYAQYRKDANPFDDRLASADQETAAAMADLKASQEMGRRIAESLPPAERDKMLAQLKAQEKQMTDSLAAMSKAMNAEHAERAAKNKAAGDEFEARFPADPNQLIARRLRAFLDETADADFTARIIRLTDGPDGMEFVAPAHRAKSVTWQLAVLAGPDATNAARAAANAWLKELAR